MCDSDEEELVRLAQQGDRNALGTLLFAAFDDVARHLEPRMPASLRRHVSVEDIVQQTFARAFSEINEFTYRGAGSFAAWLRRIAELRMLDQLRSQKRKKRGGDRVRVETRVDPFAHASATDILRLLEGDDPTASHIMRHQEADDAVRLAIDSLPEDYRRVIHLRFIAGKSIAETAELMERSEASVRALADRAKKMMREAIGRFSAYLSSRGR